MFGSFIAGGLLLLMAISNEPMYAIAAGLFELAGVLYAVTRPVRLKSKEVKPNENPGR